MLELGRLLLRAIQQTVGYLAIHEHRSRRNAFLCKLTENPLSPLCAKFAPQRRIFVKLGQCLGERLCITLRERDAAPFRIGATDNFRDFSGFRSHHRHPTRHCLDEHATKLLFPIRHGDRRQDADVHCLVVCRH